MNIISCATGLIKENKLYVWLLLFIIGINLLTFTNFSKKDNLEVRSQEFINWLEKFPSQSKLGEIFLTQDNIYAYALVFISVLSFLALVVGIVLDIIFIFQKVHKVEFIAKNSMPYETRWQLIDVIKVIILYLSIGYAIGFGHVFFLKIFKLYRFDRFARMATSLTISYSLIISLIVYFVIVKYGHKLQILGLNLKKFFKNIFLGFVSYIALLPVLALVIFIVVSLSSFFQYTPEPHPLLDVLFTENRPAFLIYLTALVCLVGPLVEEIFFRGFVYRALRKSFGIIPAILVSAVFFAWLHMTLTGFFPILILGLLLAYLYEKNGTLIPCVTVHVIHNSAIIVLLMLLKGLVS